MLFIIYPEGFTHAEKNVRKAFNLWKYLGSGVLSVLGIFLIDMGIMWFFSGWGLADWRVQLPNVLLILYTGIQYVVVGLYRKGNVLDMIYAPVVLLVLALFVHVIVPAQPVMAAFESDVPVVLGSLMGSYIVIAILKAFVLDEKEQKARDTNIRPVYLWNIGKPLRRVFNRKVNIVVWIVAVVQSMLLFCGYSILTWF